MGKGSRKRTSVQQTYIDSINCSVDLDSLIMSPECCPEYLETNLSVGDHVLYSSILNSTCSSWLLKLDVLDGFSSGFRRTLFGQFKAFPLIVQTYFRNQLSYSTNRSIHDDFSISSGVDDSEPDGNISMFNPRAMLGRNKSVDGDLDIISGRNTLRGFLDGQIDRFISTKDRSQIDFSYSIFLLEMLCPRFFLSLNEAEQMVVLSNLDRYFSFLDKFRSGGFTNVFAAGRHELNVPQNLLRWVLADESESTTERVRLLAWRKLLGEMNRLGAWKLADAGKGNGRTQTLDVLRQTSSSMFRRICNVDEVEAGVDRVLQMLENHRINIYDLEKWIDDSDGLYESLELDCTLHGLNAPDLLPWILESPPAWRLLEGMVDFQDDSGKMVLLREISRYITSFK